MPPGIDGIEAALNESRDRGVAAIGRIAAEEAPRLDLSRDVAEVYLREHLNYHLTSAERSGLELFRQLAQHQNLLTKESPAVADVALA